MKAASNVRHEIAGTPDHKGWCATCHSVPTEECYRSLAQAQESPCQFACETCHDTGEVEVMTQHLGPDDYQETIACPDCSKQESRQPPQESWTPDKLPTCSAHGYYDCSICGAQESPAGSAGLVADIDDAWDILDAMKDDASPIIKPRFDVLQRCFMRARDRIVELGRIADLHEQTMMDYRSALIAKNALEAQLAAAQADARRYRWLRRQRMSDEPYIVAIKALRMPCLTVEDEKLLHGSELDAAIDAALASPSGKENQ